MVLYMCAYNLHTLGNQSIWIMSTIDDSRFIQIKFIKAEGPRWLLTATAAHDAYTAEPAQVVHIYNSEIKY